MSYQFQRIRNSQEGSGLDKRKWFKLNAQSLAIFYINPMRAFAFGFTFLTAAFVSNFSSAQNSDIAITPAPNPLIKIPPTMPPRAEWSGVCEMVYNINAAGKAVNIRTSKCSQQMFEKPSIIAIKKYQFNPNVTSSEEKLYSEKIEYKLTDSTGSIIPIYGNDNADEREKYLKQSSKRIAQAESDRVLADERSVDNGKRQTLDACEIKYTYGTTSNQHIFCNSDPSKGENAFLFGAFSWFNQNCPVSDLINKNPVLLKYNASETLALSLSPGYDATHGTKTVNLFGGSAYAESLGCTEATGFLTSTISYLKDRKSDGAQSIFVQGCVDYYQGEYSNAQCNCVKEVGSKVFSGLNNEKAVFSSDVFSKVATQNPFLGIQLLAQCGAPPF